MYEFIRYFQYSYVLKYVFLGTNVLNLYIYIHSLDLHKIHMGVPKNRGTQKWMVKIMENPVKMDDLGVPLFSETPHIFAQISNLDSLHGCHMKISGETSPQLGPMASRCYGSRQGFGMGSSCGGDMA